MKIKKKKAFTLTELLVVVVVIGVLAAVVLPKYNAMLETRKTTEAESVLTAVRNEQELRCAADERYTTKYDQLASLSTIQKAGAYDNRARSSNFTYTVEGVGVSAQLNNAEPSNRYTLKILSYRDGRICCEGDGCKTLNKDYVKCDSFTPRQSPNSCVPEAGSGGGGEPEPPTPPAPKECTGALPSAIPVGECGINTPSCSCNDTTGEWDCDWMTSISPSFVGGTEIKSYKLCGLQTVTKVCNAEAGYTVETVYGDPYPQPSREVSSVPCRGPHTSGQYSVTTETCHSSFERWESTTEVLGCSCRPDAYNSMNPKPGTEKTCEVGGRAGKYRVDYVCSGKDDGLEEPWQWVRQDSACEVIPTRSCVIHIGSLQTRTFESEYAANNFANSSVDGAPRCDKVSAVYGGCSESVRNQFANGSTGETVDLSNSGCTALQCIIIDAVGGMQWGGTCHNGFYGTDQMHCVSYRKKTCD